MLQIYSKDYLNQVIFLIHEKVGELSKLEDFDLQDNIKLTEIPMAIGRLKLLKRFIIKNTGIDVIPYALKNLTALEDCSVRDNTGIQEIPEFFCQLIRLKKLDVSGCSISILPEMFERLEDLTFLDLRRNKLTSYSFTPNMNKLKYLNRLYLR